MSKPTINTSDLYKPNVDYTPNFKLILNCNNNPIISDKDECAWRRMITIKISKTKGDLYVKKLENK